MIEKDIEKFGEEFFDKLKEQEASVDDVTAVAGYMMRIARETKI